MRSVGGQRAWAPMDGGTDVPSDHGTVATAIDGTIDLTIPSQPAEVGAAQRAVVAHLLARSVPSTVVDDLELVASELVTNAIVHPRPLDHGRDVGINVDVSDEVCLTISNVGRADDIPPVDEWLPAAPGALSGRGLGIVRRLSDDVVVEQRGDRAVVVCRRHLPDGGAMP